MLNYFVQLIHDKMSDANLILIPLKRRFSWIRTFREMVRGIFDHHNDSRCGYSLVFNGQESGIQWAGKSHPTKIVLLKLPKRITKLEDSHKLILRLNIT